MGLQPQNLADKLIARIDRDGPMSVADYMSAALGDPDFGYYTTRDPFGSGGDFTTAPEISQMFGELIGLWIAQVWISMGSPDDICLVEPGPGRGTLMADIMRTLAKAAPALHETVELHLVEISPRLRRQQAEALKGLVSNTPAWHDSFDTLPGATTILIANEFIDALPIHQFVKSTSGWHERLVGRGAGGDAALGFCLSDDPIANPEILGLTLDPRTPVETIAEVRPQADTLIHAMARKFGPNKSAALIIDYGYAHKGYGDTFQAVRAHMPHHVLATPGEADLTAHVNFCALRSTALTCGFEATDVITQGEFLKALGIETRAARLREKATTSQASDIDSALERLVGEDRMGTLFKALALLSPGLPTPPGFGPSTGQAEP
jgi:NADH dehydrogenase [ubiquinone] 1 alpha subcomplex assembly factor 7